MAKTISSEKLKQRICPNCGGKIDVDIEEAVASCQYCGSQFDIPVSDSVREESIKNKTWGQMDENRWKEQNEREKKSAKDSRIGQIISVAAAVILMVAAIIVEKNDGNSSMLELAGMAVIIASAVSLGRRNVTYVEFGITAVGILLVFLTGYFVENNSAMELGGGLAIIIEFINFARMAGRNRR